MNHRIFSVFDDKAKAFLPPFILPVEAMAVRVFSDMCNSDSHQFGAHPADYTLFDLGEFDDCLGQLNSETARSVINGLLCVDVRSDRYVGLTDDERDALGVESLSGDNGHG